MARDPKVGLQLRAALGRRPTVCAQMVVKVFLCVAAIDALLPLVFVAAEALQYQQGCSEFAVEWLLPPYSFNHNLLDVPLLALLRVLCLVAVIRSQEAGGAGGRPRRKLTLAVAYPAFRLSTLLYTCFVACKLGELHFEKLPSPTLGYFLCAFSLFACWISAVVPYVHAAEDPLSYAQAPLLLDCAICLGRLEQGDVAARLCSETSHCFHERCLQPWVLRHGTCPICRAAPQHSLF